MKKWNRPHTEVPVPRSAGRTKAAFPFGETWVQNGGNDKVTPYLYTSKELDSETGLYYFGARYYDPRTSIWQSADPILKKYLPNRLDKKQQEKDFDPMKDLPGAGGVYASQNLALYTYSYVNPIKYFDPDGNSPFNLIAGAIGAAIGGVSAGVTAYVKGGSVGDVLTAAGIGTATGAVTGFTLGAAGTVVVGGIASGAGSATGQFVSTGDVKFNETAMATVAGTVGGVTGILARKGGSTLAEEALISSMATGETQAIFDFGQALDEKFPTPLPTVSAKPISE